MAGGRSTLPFKSNQMAVSARGGREFHGRNLSQNTLQPAEILLSFGYTGAVPASIRLPGRRKGTAQFIREDAQQKQDKI